MSCKHQLVAWRTQFPKNRLTPVGFHTTDSSTDPAFCYAALVARLMPTWGSTSKGYLSHLHHLIGFVSSPACPTTPRSSTRTQFIASSIVVPALLERIVWYCEMISFPCPKAIFGLIPCAVPIRHEPISVQVFGRLFNNISAESGA